MALNSPSPQLRLALDVLEGYGNLDAAKAFSYFSEDYKFEMLPKSMFGGKVRSKAELYPLIEMSLNMFKSLRVRQSEHSH